MLSSIALITFFASFIGISFAATVVPARQKVTPTSISEFAPYTQFARAVYCPIRKLELWNCGQACKALSTFKLSLVGGNGDNVQQYIVGYWPPQKTVIVAHEGTDPLRFLSVLTDVDVLQSPLSPALFPGIAPSIRVHDGFRRQHAMTALVILAEVKRLLNSEHANKVTVVGHSLGGALAELDSLYFALNLPKTVSIKAVTYGTPRVGNLVFAQAIDQMVPDFKRINNRKDLVPIIPGRLMGFAHPHGETHILFPGKVVSCPGNDDATDLQCQIRTVPTIIEGNLNDHLGPYDGIYIGTLSCY